MPVPETAIDPEVAPRYLHGLLSPDHAMYRIALRQIRLGRTAASQEAIGAHLRMWLRWLRVQGIDAANVTPDDVLRWLNELAHLRPATQESYLGAVRRLYKLAAYEMVVARNPAEFVKVGAYDSPSVPALRLDTVNCVLSSLRNEMRDPSRGLAAARDYFIFTLGLTLGPRSGGLRRLTLGDIRPDEDPPTITFFEKFRRYHTVRMPRPVGEVLMLYQAALESALGRPLDPSDALVIPLNRPTMRTLWGTPPPLRPMSSVGLGSVVRERLLDAGVSGDKLGPHRLRKTFATLAYQQNVVGTDIKEALGHRRLSVTYDHYIAPAERLERAPGDDLPLDFGGGMEGGQDGRE